MRIGILLSWLLVYQTSNRITFDRYSIPMVVNCLRKFRMMIKKQTIIRFKRELKNFFTRNSSNGFIIFCQNEKE